MKQALALLLTLAIEVPVALAIARLAFRPPLAPRALLVPVLAASLLTHPFAWAANELLRAHLPFTLRAAIIEAAVVAAETLVLRQAAQTPWLRAMALSFTANAASFLTGLWAWTPLTRWLGL